MTGNNGHESMAKDQLQVQQVEQIFLPDKIKSLIIAKDTFSSTVNILGAESGGGEPLTDFIIKGNETNSNIC